MRFDAVEGTLVAAPIAQKTLFGPVACLDPCMLSYDVVALLLQRRLQLVIHTWAKQLGLMSSSPCLAVGFSTELW